jgi:hypothetical protein
MRMRSAIRHTFVVACAVFLFAGLGFPVQPHEAPMKSEQNVQSQEQATYTRSTTSTRPSIAMTPTRWQYF